MTYFTKDKPYNTLNEYNKFKYNSKVAKISLNGGFTCPNKDGKVGIGGCIYCSSSGSGDFAGDIKLSFHDQYYQIKNIIDKKWKNTKYMPYLQANSNTYKSVDELRKIYNEIIDIDKDNTVGIAIATRADCIDLEIVELLKEINQKKEVIIELGLQTSNENTAKLINRCMTNECFKNAVYMLSKANIFIVVHIINGLPYETYDDMLNTIKFVNSLPINAIKFHSLLVLKNTKLNELYEKEKFHILTMDEYVKITSMQICNLRDDIIIERLQADSSIEDLVEPKWSRKKLLVMDKIDMYLRDNKLYQGIYYKKEQ